MRLRERERERKKGGMEGGVVCEARDAVMSQ